MEVLFLSKLISPEDNNLSNILSKVNQMNALTFDKKEFYIKKYKEWLYNGVERNLRIKRNNKLENKGRKRQSVFCLDFGVNIGSEFNFFHFCVVIKEFDYTAIVVPLSTEKENDPEWKSASNLILPIGEIEDMPKDKKPVYAMINQIKTVSKQRLSDYFVKEESKYYPMMLNEDQMKIILDAITSSIGNQEVKIKKKTPETV